MKYAVQTVYQAGCLEALDEENVSRIEDNLFIENVQTPAWLYPLAPTAKLYTSHPQKRKDKPYDLRDNLKAILTDRGLDIGETAKAIGKTKEQLVAIMEKRDDFMSTDFLNLCSALGMTTEEFMNYKKEEFMNYKKTA